MSNWADSIRRRGGIGVGIREGIGGGVGLVVS